MLKLLNLNTSTAHLTAILLGLALASFRSTLHLSTSPGCSPLTKMSDDEFQLPEFMNGVNVSKQSPHKRPRPPAAASSASGRAVVDEIKELVMATAELSVETKVENREMWAMLVRTVLTDAESPPVVAGLAAGTEHNKLVASKKGANVGAAHTKICLAFMQALLQTKDFKDLAADHPLKAIIMDWWKSVRPWTPDKLAEQLMNFKLTKPRVASKVDGLATYAKLQIAFHKDSQEVALRLVQFMEEQGAILKVGTAPQTTKGRKVRDLLGKMINK